MVPTNARSASPLGDVRNYLQILRRRRLTIIVVGLLVVAIGVGITVVEPPSYTATADVLLSAQPLSAALEPASTQIQPTSDYLARELSDAQQIALGDDTKGLAAKKLGYAPDVEVGISSTADILTFSSSDRHPAAAATAVNEYARAFVTAYVQNKVDQYADQVTGLQQSLSELKQQAASDRGSQSQAQAAANAASITSLSQSLQQLQASSDLARTTAPTLVKAAARPSSPSSPKLAVNIFLSVVLGLVLGLGLAFLRERLDDKIKSVDDVERSSGERPLIGVIPLVDSWTRDSLHHLALNEDQTSRVSEAYRVLRTSIQFIDLEEHQRILGITSSAPNEGKSTATANLAISFAAAGRRVVAVSCDLRRPRLHQFFGLSNEVGLTSVLLREASLQEAMQLVPGEPNLRLLTSGPIPPNPAEILSSKRVDDVIRAIVSSADIVLLDCPPVLPVSDSLLVSRLCDSIYVIAVASTTRKADLRQTYAMLGQVGAPLRGTIVNRVASTRLMPGAYGYSSYSYSYSYDRSDGSVTENGGRAAQHVEEQVP